VSLDADRVEDDEVVARFLFDRDDFVPTTGRVKPKPFLPSPEDDATSVFRTGGLSETDTWALASPRGMRIAKARGTLQGGQIRWAGLDVVPMVPPPRHAAIVNWPAKDARLSLAQRLAELAKLVLRPETQPAERAP